MSSAQAPGREVRLDDALTAEDGPVLLSGIRALVRLVLEQRRGDARRGLDTRAFVSGYQGSPLGGVDRAMQGAREHLDRAGVVFRPGLNEELAATAVAGTQLLGQLDRRTTEGVTGWWYGKAPGLDRAADAIRHGNLSGTAPLGGAVAWIGDDPTAKSSTVPSSSEPLCRSLVVPLLAPGSVGDVVRLGLHAAAMSRHAGLWTGLKITADVADATAVVDVTGVRDGIPAFRPREAHHAPVLLPPTNLDAELDLLTGRLDRVHEYARAAGLNHVVASARAPRLAIVAAGPAFAAVQRALQDLGVDRDGVDALRLRLVRLDLPWPLDRALVREQLADVEAVLVVEDKTPFLEGLVRDALYGVPRPPAVLGREDHEGRPLLPARAAVDADDVARALGRLLPADRLDDRGRARLAVLSGRDLAAATPATGAALPPRTPYFCSGCPHNVSTKAPVDTLVGVGIGCHTMVALDDDRRGTLLGMPQMGGEGAQWIGLSPFTDDEHLVQNMGDGTFHHSGSLAIRAAVAAGVNVTYKLLYNDAVAMTGGQHPEGQLSIPDLTRWLTLEGVARVVVTTPEPHDYRRVALDPTASVRHRDDLQDVQAELAAVPGVTVLIHDDRCATEERRLRKRGKLPTPPGRITINERVCEGCGDCGEASTCLSVQPVETTFGRKTQIHQSSCTQDRSCLKGDCPSFLTVVPAKGAVAALPHPGTAGSLPVALPEPVRRVPDDVLIRMPGVGGTGVVTVSQVLQMAAHLDGLHAAGLEQIGLAQKGGPVLSDVRLGPAPIDGQLRASTGSADLLLGLDLLGAAADATLRTCDPARTVAVTSVSRVPTAGMVTDRTVRPPSPRGPLGRIDAATRAEDGLRIDAQALSEALFRDHMPANLLLLGAAFQHGCVPVSADAIERAIALNGAAVDQSLAAFRWGRAAAVDLRAVERAAGLADDPRTAGRTRGGRADEGAPGEVGRGTAVVSDAGTLGGGRPGSSPDPRIAALVAEHHLDGRLADLVAHRAGELVLFQDLRCARRYVADVASVARREHEATGGDRVARAYAVGLHKLVAYKDEYEIARLHLDGTERARVAAEFGPGAKVRVMLQPPLLRALGVDRKIACGPWIRPVFGVLRRMRRLRGTPLDPFGHTRVRRVERALPGEYRALVDRALRALRPETVAQAVAIAELPDVVRGYEDVKLRGVADFRERAAAAVAALEATPIDPTGPVLAVRVHRVGAD
ncbi:indolepyruvate ferredoxin oxidoreductase family protein [Patulibacter minatonensis]|uniref:indolepyruvate ferredoxin oxidoreductase family protein n=1 Tax=Patulibacter minatonensis TaxID=298163 RepID=UPI00047BA5D4|nr:indolepyruvate ferredoxin oxidoreductase family protein [Patulibacter minatonensis]